MDKRILVVGCIPAVAILIGVSFTSVVGYSSKQSNSIETPLYNLRINRAIENGEDLTTCDYVGKGKGLTIPISEWDNLGALRQQLLDKLKGKNEKELKALRKSIFKLINQKGFTKEKYNAKVLTPTEDWTECNEFTCNRDYDICVIFQFLIILIFGPILVLLFIVFLITALNECIDFNTIWCNHTIDTQCDTFCPTCDLETWCNCFQ